MKSKKKQIKGGYGPGEYPKKGGSFSIAENIAFGLYGISLEGGAKKKRKSKKIKSKKRKSKIKSKKIKSGKRKSKTKSKTKSKKK